MTRRTRSWPDQARSFIGYCLSEPLYRLFRLVPHWEVGLSTHEISRLTYVHGPLAGRRAVHQSDLHIDCYQPRHDHIVAAIGKLEPDCIFVTGDLLNVPEGLPHVFRFLAGLREIAPVFVTLGNHDHYSGVTFDQYCELADRHKITLLINQATFSPTGCCEIAIV
jgi:predicted MPP superfamily phosphohydrolase